MGHVVRLLRALPKLRLEFPLAAPTVPATIDPPSARGSLGVDYDTAWARSFASRWVRAVLLDNVLQPTVRALAKPERRGLDRLADLEARWRDDDVVEPLIFAANHHSHIDSALIITSLPEPWRHKVFVGAAADYFFRTRVTGAVSALTLNAVPIERNKVSRRSAHEAAVLIDEGWSMLIFPEGGRSPDGWGQPFRGGAAYLSLRCGVPVVPIHVGGSGRVLPKGKRTPTRAPTTVTFGAPLVPDIGEDSRRFGARLERAVAALADEAITDWYSARLRAHHGATPTLGGPTSVSWRRAWALGDRAPKNGSARRQVGPTWPDLG